MQHDLNNIYNKLLDLLFDYSKLGVKYSEDIALSQYFRGVPILQRGRIFTTYNFIVNYTLTRRVKCR